MQIDKLKGHGAMFSANIIWGLMSPAGKYIFLAGLITPMILVDMRIVGGAVLCWIASFFTKREHVPARDLLRLFFAGLFGIVLNQGLFTIGLSMTSPVNASILTTITPFFTLIIAALYLHEKISVKKLSGLLIGAAGALILILGNSENTADGGSAPGDIICMVSEIGFAVYVVFFKDIIDKYSPITLMKWMFTFSSICVLPFTFTDIGTFIHHSMPCDPYLILSIFVVVFGGTFICYLLAPIGQKYLPPTVVSMYCYVQPVVSALVVIIYWKTDSFTVCKAIAIALVFAGVYLVTQSHQTIESEKDLRFPPNSPHPDEH